MRKIQHTNGIKIHEVYETKNSVYVVQDLLKGGEIFRISDGRLNSEDAKIILRALLEFLAYLQSINIVHRDLKPDNIILLKNKKKCSLAENTIKVIDYGLAWQYTSEKRLIHRRCGTPGFIAPEILNLKKGENNIEKCFNCDVFSLGMIFFFMLTGKIPYDGEDLNAILENNKAGMIDWNIKELNEYRGKPELDLLYAMLNFDPKLRITAEGSQPRRLSATLTSKI